MKTLYPLEPLAVGFRLGVAIRSFAYREGWRKTRRLARPVVSVGNLTLGGTGKTPLVALVACTLAKMGLRPAILTRGYRRRADVDLVALEPCAPGWNRTADPRAVGDEPALLARLLPEVPIVISSDRYRAGRLAEDRFGAGAHILDDGFQHLALARDVDIVVLDATRELSDWALLPAGRQREPCSALARADLVVLTRTELADPSPLECRVRQVNPKVRIFHASTKLCGLVDVTTDERHTPAALKARLGQTFWAFCGLGNPDAFFADLRAWGFTVAGETAFRDHHLYRGAELLDLETRALRTGAPALLTTEKDAMNLPADAMTRPPIFACAIELELREPQALEQELATRLAALRMAD
ncbi:MAG TPA: tetraacyldisaccharide 4'-kinase [Terriglobia bacterium]|nr:tetraacyldisaccharide 4'-kinase [Terriglobia bacterium]